MVRAGLKLLLRWLDILLDEHTVLRSTGVRVQEEQQTDGNCAVVVSPDRDIHVITSRSNWHGCACKVDMCCRKGVVRAVAGELKVVQCGCTGFEGCMPAQACEHYMKLLQTCNHSSA